MDPLNTAEEIDRLVTVDIGARGVVRKLYHAARGLTSGPLCLEAANRLREKVKRDDAVLIVTGFPQLPSYLQETDGPVGASALARVVSFTLNAVPIVVTDEIAVDCTRSTLRAMELNVLEQKDVTKGLNATAVVPFPVEEAAAEPMAVKLVEEYNPSAVVVIEKVGRNAGGYYHNMRGLDVSLESARVEPLIATARERGAFTIGIGDGGNEVGMGNIIDEVKRSVPNAVKCKCPCGGGIAAVSKVDLLVVAAVSNWGGYAIETCIDMLEGRSASIHPGEMERRAIDACTAAGAVDGMRGIPQASVDGISGEVNGHVVDILRAIASRYA